MKILRFLLFGVVLALGVSALSLFAGFSREATDIQWGVNFSKKHATALGLDWKEVYTALLDDLEVERMKVSFDWNDLELEQGEFSFEDADWQVAQAEQRGAELLLVVGMKTMRWPECHIPEWAKGLSKQEQQEEILQIIAAVVERYKDSPAVYAWQVENEPLFPFGDCPWQDRKFLEKEVALVKSLDASRPVVVSDSGELSFWLQASRIGDIVSTTMYRKVWFHEIGRYVEYPLPSLFYARKAAYVNKLFGKEVIVGELQAEPWGPGKLLYDTTIEEQDAAFDLTQFRKNIAYARKTGLKEFYFWGAEWWDWRTETANDPTFWEEARMLFKEVPCLEVEIADTPDLQIQGLSGRQSLDEDKGMLFVYEKPAVLGFWMKDMRFPIDIIWLGDDMRVLGIEARVSPDTYPTVFYSPEPVRYVLEVNAGWAERNGITPGNEICLPQERR